MQVGILIDITVNCTHAQEFPDCRIADEGLKCDRPSGVLTSGFNVRLALRLDRMSGGIGDDRHTGVTALGDPWSSRVPNHMRPAAATPAGRDEE